MATWKFGKEEFEINMQYVLHDRDFLRKHKDNLTKEQWNYWTYWGHGNEKDFAEFKDYVNWVLVAANYKLSDKFVREHKDYINMELLFSNVNMSNLPVNIKQQFYKGANLTPSSSARLTCVSHSLWHTYEGYGTHFMLAIGCTCVSSAPLS